MWKLDEVSHDMFVLMLPRVSSRVSGFPAASPCLWGKLQDLSFSKVSKQVVMLLCVAGAALCDICLITPPKLFCVAGAIFLWHFPQDEWHLSWPSHHFSDLSHCFAWQAQHSRLHTPHSTLYTPPLTLHTLHSTLDTLHSTLYTPHSTLYTL